MKDLFALLKPFRIVSGKGATCHRGDLSQHRYCSVTLLNCDESINFTPAQHAEHQRGIPAKNKTLRITTVEWKAPTKLPTGTEIEQQLDARACVQATKESSNSVFANRTPRLCSHVPLIYLVVRRWRAAASVGGEAAPPSSSPHAPRRRRATLPCTRDRPCGPPRSPHPRSSERCRPVVSESLTPLSPGRTRNTIKPIIRECTCRMRVCEYVRGWRPGWEG